MELHHALRELVDAHGRSILDDAAGFRGVLDDVLAEDQASTGDINLLVDAVRFGSLDSLVGLTDGGADPGRAVEEAGLRLARNRGGDDAASATWACAVLGFAVRAVPEAVVLRHRAARPSAGRMAPPAGPPLASPPTAWPAQPAPQPPPPPQMSPPSQWPAQPAHSGSQGQHGQAPGGLHQPIPFATTAPAKRRATLLWVAAAVAGVVVAAGGATAALVASDGGGGGGGGGGGTPSASTSDDVDVDPAALDERYSALSTTVSAGASDCAAQTPGAGQVEAVRCVVPTGTLTLVTFADEAGLSAARTSRLDYRAGTLTSTTGANALYEFDPDRGGSSDPAIVYWDSTSGLQSATLRGEGSATIDQLVSAFDETSPRVSEPTGPEHPTLREFIDINMDVSACTRQRTFFVGETEESTCEADVSGISVSVGRYATAEAMKEDRRYYKRQYAAAATTGNGPDWRFDEGAAEGAYFAYLDETGETATLYWDWDEPDCHCYGVAWSFDGDLQKLEDWWPNEE